MKNAYGGESNAKKIARWYMWEHFAIRMSAAKNDGPGAGKARVAILSGPEGRDIETAVAYGFASQNIWAIDTDKAALDSARGRLREQGEGVHWTNAAFEDVVENEQFDIIFLDSCGLVLKVAQTAITRMLTVRGRTWKTPEHQFDLEFLTLGVGGMYGRDGALLKQSQRRRSHRKGASAARKRFSQFNQQCVDVAADNLGAWYPQRAVSYVSHRKEKKGVPMLYTAGMLVKHDVTEEGAMRVTRRTRRMMKAQSKRHRQKISGKMPLLELGSDVDGTKLRKSVCYCLQEGEDAARVAKWFGISASQVRAWKAHLTRGTYGDAIDPKTIGERIS